MYLINNPIFFFIPRILYFLYTFLYLLIPRTRLKRDLYTAHNVKTAERGFDPISGHSGTHDWLANTWSLVHIGQNCSHVVFQQWSAARLPLNDTAPFI